MNPVVKLNLTLSRIRWRSKKPRKLNFYNTALLQQLVENNKAGAKTNLLEIIDSCLLQPGEGSEQIQARRHFVLQCP